MSGQRIIAEFWRRPGRDRRFDWSATFDDYDLGRPIGWGRTEAEAIADLIENFPQT